MNDLRLADIHCHVLPYVDDGAAHVEEMEKLLADESSQGVEYVCATPHLRKDMFETDDEAVAARFRAAREYIKEAKLPIRLLLGREYHCDELFLEKLAEGTLIPLGFGNTVLMEFSGRSGPEDLESYIGEAQKHGIQPLVAHVERYARVDVPSVRRIRDLGAMIQVNAGSLLGREGRLQKKHSWRLLKEGLVDVVASDAHDPQYRPVELELCADKIERKAGQAMAERVLWNVPMKILTLDKGE